MYVWISLLGPSTGLIESVRCKVNILETHFKPYQVCNLHISYHCASYWV